MSDPRLNLTQTISLGEELEQMRRNQNISLEKLSELVGRSTRQLYRYEKRDIPIPHDILVQWIAVLGYELAVINKDG